MSADDELMAMPARRKRIAVVTDAISEEFSFPYWHRYYGGLFGPSNLFVLTYEGKAKRFAGVTLGGLIELPVGFDDAVRPAVVGRFIETLLACYDLVIRVDTDEFLVVDPEVAPSLAAYAQTMAEPYVTARGFDVIQLPGEAPLAVRDGLTLLRDRGYAYPNTALNKTCVATTAIQWSAGFHWASVYPKFGPVFMLHMKRVDVAWQMSLLRKMTADIEHDPSIEPPTREYFRPDEAKIVAYHAGVDERPRLSGIGSWYRHRLIAGFLADVGYNTASGLYSGRYGHEHVLCEIPREWKRAI